MIFRFFKKKEPPTLHHFVSVVLTAAAVVLFWRGAWGLMDHYLFPDMPVLSYGTSILLGLFILWVDDRRISELDHH